MDCFLELMDTSRLFERVILPGGQIGGRAMPDPDPEPDELSSDPVQIGDDQNYVVEHQLREENEIEDEDFDYELTPATRPAGSLFEVENLSECSKSVSAQHEMQLLNSVYQNFDFSTSRQANLPILNDKERIVRMIDAFQTVVIVGETGCGKTTQVPQFILDAHRQNGRYCNIVVTQPRRIAATSIAQRVCSERNWPLGSLVGYKIGLNENTSSDTRLLYCTTGVLLQTIIAERNLDRFTHIIVDEVHERDKDMDFLLLVLRKLQRKVSKGVKLILMSATINAERFAQYFAMASTGGCRQSAPIIEVTTKSKYHVSKYYLEDLHQPEIPQLYPNLDHPAATMDHHILCRYLIKRFDTLEASEQQHSRSAVVSKGTVLVFLPGIVEIEDVYNLLIKDQAMMQWKLLTLHSNMTREEQAAAFVPPQPGFRKIILSTNIAESSITVPDIKYVIDYCLMKQLVIDPVTNFACLELTWTSKANCEQRAGRCGRVCNGRVYRLIGNTQYASFMEEQIPEMRRSSLENLVLMSKLVNLGSPKALLALALDPPDLRNISKTVKLLKEAGGLLMKCRGEDAYEDGDITFLGRIMARLPLDIHVSKLIALGHIFGVLEDCIIMGAALSTKTMFNAPYHERLEAYTAKLAWSAGSSSDPIAFLNAFKAWRNNMETGFFSRTPKSCETEWARRCFLEIRTVREVCDLVCDIQRRLRYMNITPQLTPEQSAWSHDEEPLILKLVLAGSFYPNYFVSGCQGARVVEKDAVRTLVGRDPYSTVYLQGMPLNHPGELYTKDIKAMFSILDTHTRVSFDDTNKAYIEFASYKELSTITRKQALHPYKPRMPGRIALSVYCAIKMRHLKADFSFRAISDRQAQERSERFKNPPLQAFSSSRLEQFHDDCKKKADLRSRWKTNDYSPVPSSSSCISASSSIDIKHLSILPSVTLMYGYVKACYVENVGKFWVHIDESFSELEKVTRLLNCGGDVVPLASPPRIGQIIIAPYHENEEAEYLYRARVIEIMEGGNSVRVQFIDYGNQENVAVKRLKDFGPTLMRQRVNAIAGLAVQSTLACVRPSMIKGSGMWNDDANKYLARNLLNQKYYAKIYSVVNSIMTLIIYKGLDVVSSEDDMKGSFNEELIKKKYAQRAKETYLSIQNNKIREEASLSCLNKDQELHHDEKQHSQFVLDTQNDPIPPHASETCNTVRLKGPFSPLEMNVYQMIRGGSQKSIKMDSQSVNCVLLDDDPQIDENTVDNFDRLVVASTVHASQDGTSLTLRQTTLMPNIPGLPALISLLFAPQVELRADKNNERLTGALCGLGVDMNCKSYFPEHDMEILFDTKFTMLDIQNINKLRYWISVALFTDEDSDLPNNSPADIVQYQTKVKKFIQELLRQERSLQKPTIQRKAYKWGQISDEFILSPGTCNLQGREVYSMVSGIALKPEGTARVKELAENNNQLFEICRCDMQINEAHCLLCKTTLYSLMDLRLHLQTLGHTSAVATHITAKSNLLDMEYFDQADEDVGDLQSYF